MNFDDLFQGDMTLKKKHLNENCLYHPSVSSKSVLLVGNLISAYCLRPFNTWANGIHHEIAKSNKESRNAL